MSKRRSKPKRTSNPTPQPPRPATLQPQLATLTIVDARPSPRAILTFAVAELTTNLILPGIIYYALLPLAIDITSTVEIRYSTCGLPIKGLKCAVVWVLLKLMVGVKWVLWVWLMGCLAYVGRVL